MAWTGVINAYRQHLPVTDATPVISLVEGNTPLIPAPRLGRELGLELYFKFEGLNPTGSFKDRGMTMAVSKALEAGCRAVMCASTGNTSASAAAYAARAGVPCFVLIPDSDVALGKVAQSLVYGARTLQVQGNFDDALALVRRLTAEHPQVGLVNSVNPFRLQGQKTGAFEIADGLGRAPEFLAIPVGNAGNITAYWMGFSEYGRGLPRMIGFQAEGAAPMVTGQPVDQPKTLATAIKIGKPATREGAARAAAQSGGGFWAVSDDEIITAYRLLASTEGLFAEPASCATVAGLTKLSRQGFFTGRPTVVAILTGHGLKDPERAIAVSPPPLRLPNDYSALVETVLG